MTLAARTAHKLADDVVTRAERDQPIAPGSRFVLDLSPDELGGCCRDLAHARLEQRAKLVDAGLPAARAKHVGKVRADAGRGDREELDAHRFRQVVLLNLDPEL